MKNKFYKTILFLNKKHWVKDKIKQVSWEVPTNPLVFPSHKNIKVNVFRNRIMSEDFIKCYFFPKLALKCLIKLQPEIILTAKDYQIQVERLYFEK